MKFSTKKWGSFFFLEKRPNPGGGARGGFDKRPYFSRIFFLHPSLSEEPAKFKLINIKLSLKQSIIDEPAKFKLISIELSFEKSIIIEPAKVKFISIMLNFFKKVLASNLQSLSSLVLS